MEGEEELKETIASLEALCRHKTMFISTVSHEFRTYITALSMNLQMLEMYDAKWPPEKKATVFRRLAGSMKSMIRLLDEVSFLSKNMDNNFHPSYAEFDILAFCREAIDRVNQSGEFPARITLETEPESGLLVTDSTLVSLLVNNLLINAVKFSPKGEPVRVTLQKEGDELVMTVADNGIGIPDEAREEVFKDFFRAKNALEYPGSGLGLTVAKKATDLLHGTINFESKENQGTVFSVQLPMNSSRAAKNE
jgi:signal transduction histidine kinase